MSQQRHLRHRKFMKITLSDCEFETIGILTPQNIIFHSLCWFVGFKNSQYSILPFFCYESWKLLFQLSHLSTIMEMWVNYEIWNSNKQRELHCKTLFSTCCEKLRIKSSHCSLLIACLGFPLILTTKKRRKWNMVWHFFNFIAV